MRTIIKVFYIIFIIFLVGVSILFDFMGISKEYLFRLVINALVGIFIFLPIAAGLMDRVQIAKKVDQPIREMVYTLGIVFSVGNFAGMLSFGVMSFVIASIVGILITLAFKKLDITIIRLVSI